MRVPETKSPQRFTGKIKWFNSTKGYGFIVPDKGDTECFVHYTELPDDTARNSEGNFCAEPDAKCSFRTKPAIKPGQQMQACDVEWED